MFPYSITRSFIQDNPKYAIFSALVSFGVALIVSFAGIRYFTESAIGILLSAAALYVGTFTAFLGLLFSLVTSPLGAIVEPSTYQKRLDCLKLTIQSTTLSVVLSLLTVPTMVLAQENAILPLYNWIFDIPANIYNQFFQPVLFSVAVFLLTYVFCLTLKITREMYSLAHIASKDKEADIRKQANSAKAVGTQSPSKQAKSATSTTN